MENPRIEEKELDIHHRKKSLENTKRILKQSKIGSRNKTLILEYVRSKVLGESIGVARQEKLIRHLRILAEHLGRQFDKAAKSDIEKLVEKLYSSEVKWGERKKKISEWSKYDYVVILKGFFQWLKNCKEPEETSWIKPPRPRPKRLKPADIISWEDAVAMSKAATNPRDRCLPLILWGSGLRIQELLTLKLKDVEQVNGGEAVILHLRQSKTDERDPLVVRGAAALLDWMHYHPLGDNENSYLFVNLQNNRPLEYPQTRLKLKELAKRAKIEKDVNPHAFRKASASYYLHFLTPSELKARFGWTQSSKQLDVYCFPDEDRVNQRLLEIHGLAAAENGSIGKPESMTKTCSVCGKVNEADREYCSICKRPLDMHRVTQVEELKRLGDESLEELEKEYPEINKLFKEILKRKFKTYLGT